MPDFLLELRSEEIPARMQAGARNEMEKLFRREMDAAGVAVGEVTVWSTPRRLALIARDLPEATEAVSEEAKGPPEGAPDQAVEGFCRKNGVTRDELEVRDVKGRPTYFAVKNIPGRATSALLAEAIPAIVRDFAWPKSMRWGAASISTESLRWVRPLSGIVALLGDDVVECEVHGVTSGAVTLGHRFHHSGDITIGNADDYALKLRAGHVIVDHAERQDLIRTGAAKVAQDADLTLVEDEGLVIENAGLTEWPVPLLGRFEEDFLEVPPETIQLTARVNQKYFVCEDAKGELANAFVCTANIEAADGGERVVEGNRKVLAARLADARFFWDVDRKKTLAEHAEGLKRITFHEKLGTVADKVERVKKLALWLVDSDIVKPHEDTASAKTELYNRVQDAAALSKADLVTEMVGEFPELQGLMGGYYARAEGLPDAVADAIRDHYKPVGHGDDVPTAPVTVAVSLADKLDTLVGFFAIGQKPSGSKDPFALRRAVLGVIQILQSNGIAGNLSEITSELFDTLSHQLSNKPNLLRIQYSSGPTHPRFGKWETPHFIFEKLLETSTPGSRLGFDSQGRETKIIKVGDDEVVVFSEPKVALVSKKEVIQSLLDFFADRLKVQQREAGVRHDLIDAVFALGGEDDLVRLLARVKALQSFMDTEDGANLLAGYKRAANILKKENHPGTPAQAGVQDGADDQADLDSGLRGNDDGLSYTPEIAEKALIDALDSAGPKAEAAVADEDFAAAMSALASLRAPIDRFFEEVTVNDDDPGKRAFRLDLLARFRDAVHQVADFSKIEG